MNCETFLTAVTTFWLIAEKVQEKKNNISSGTLITIQRCYNNIIITLLLVHAPTLWCNIYTWTVQYVLFYLISYFSFTCCSSTLLEVLEM